MAALTDRIIRRSFGAGLRATFICVDWRLLAAAESVFLRVPGSVA